MKKPKLLVLQNKMSKIGLSTHKEVLSGSLYIDETVSHIYKMFTKFIHDGFTMDFSQQPNITYVYIHK